MATFYQAFDSAPDALTITLASLADAAGADSNAIDNSSDRFYDADLEVKLDGTASSTGLCEIYLLRSVDNSDFTDAENAELIGTVKMNGTTAVAKVLRIVSLPKYYKIRVVNNSGAALESTGSSLALLGINQADA